MNNKGISLVALVITIVVMIILTGVVLLNVGEKEGIIDESQTVVDKFNKNSLIDKIKEEVLLKHVDKEVLGHDNFTIAQDVVPILEQYGTYNPTTLELTTQENITIKLYEIMLLPINEYVTTSTGVNGITVTTTLSNTIASIQYSIDNGTNWLSYTTSINSENAIIRLVDIEGNEISDRLQINGNNDVTIIDTTAPVIVIPPAKSESMKSANISISVLDSGGLATDNVYQYCLSTSSTDTTGASWLSYQNGKEITIGEGLEGTYYVHVKAVKDTSNNESEAYVSKAYNFDNTKPSISLDISQTANSTYNMKIDLSDNTGFDFNKCRYILTQSSVSLGDAVSNYADGTLVSASTTLEVGICGQYYLHVIATDKAGNSQTYVTSQITGNDVQYGTVLNTSTFSYTGSGQPASLDAGKYKFEAWGAQGNDANNNRASGGKGAYTAGLIELSASKTFYVYVGAHRTDRSASFNAGTTGGNGSDTANGGSTNGYGGGGATDFRLTNGDWNNSASLISRIMVAAGGGGATNYAYAASGGYGGALVGGNGINGKYPNAGVPNVPPKGATQTTGGATSVLSASGGTGAVGTFGVGGNGNSSWGSGGGGGYYGGAGGGYTGNSVDSGAGGSSFVSGYEGCNAVNSSGTHTGSSAHYSGYSFNNIQMLAGNEVIPNYTNDATMTGNTGNGYAKITKYEPGYKYLADNTRPSISVNISKTANNTYSIQIDLSSDSALNFNNCKYKLATSNTSLGGNVSNYSDGTLATASTTLEVGICGRYFLHVIATNAEGICKTYISDVIIGTNETYASGKTEKNFVYTDNAEPEYEVLNNALYKLEAWGAQGGSYGKTGGLGGYTSGYIYAEENTTVYAYVGQCGDGLTTQTYNGGGAGANQYNARSGGGATDFRLQKGSTWSDSASLRSRIMVAAGGGGSDYYSSVGCNGGAGGGLTGSNGGYYRSGGSASYTVSTGGTQTAGGAGGSGAATGGAGTFGVGGSQNANHGGGGGGGYYGGGAGCYNGAVVGSGAGGSSFISGYTGCNAINSSGNHTGGPVHYSGKAFIDCTMTAGNNTGNGSAKITKYVSGYEYI